MHIDPLDLDIRSRYRLLISSVVPRPIALVSTVGEDGVYNVAPFSMFMGVSSNPPMLAVSIASRKGAEKDTTRNIKKLRDFVVNVVDESLAEKMNLTSADLPPEVSEFEYAGLTPVESVKVRSPRVKEAPVSMECSLVESIRVGDSPNDLFIGQVRLFHVADDLFNGSIVEIEKLRPLGRLGEFLYCNVRDIFEMPRPKLGEKEGK
jgi:flavin reductase (DIM6/NTAB) family NADH-FMN oxidoreductase RutF